MTDPNQDLEAKEFRDLVWNIMVEAGKPNLADYFPILHRIDPQGIRRRMTGHFEKLIKLFDGLIKERLEQRGVGNTSESTSTTDDLDKLIKMLQIGEIDEAHIQHLFIDLFAVGTDTTSSTMEWAMSEILRNSETILLQGGILPEKLDMEEKFGITLAKLHPLRALATPVVL
ncbi:7-ethoxycoumarin o-deethylase [Heracleum sosnowskyi]|uniref:7-ethoxycoumarin o-deethylase n=1 Tax=Heracleum sosnowskyi TaxID=360622 RepID=A0AAD8ILG0_9APIA|nr:7-ethoxycoumarin o-deethylase [Heracleum sosnowskyi]